MKDKIIAWLRRALVDDPPGYGGPAYAEALSEYMALQQREQELKQQVTDERARQRRLS